VEADAREEDSMRATTSASASEQPSWNEYIVANE